MIGSGSVTDQDRAQLEKIITSQTAGKTKQKSTQQ